ILRRKAAGSATGNLLVLAGAGNADAAQRPAQAAEPRQHCAEKPMSLSDPEMLMSLRRLSRCNIESGMLMWLSHRRG
ncbi:MAG: hypothetical protein J4N83_05935, partial [Chloroflexi bacterium]|nr:hypothetical protein [Chloroflexota bacterium]